MNHLIEKVLPALPADADPRLRTPWASYLIFGNCGAVPLIDLPPGRYLWNRGFLLLLLDRHGQPTHVCKVRPDSDEGALREGMILPRLCMDPELRPFIPAAVWHHVDGIQVTMAAFVAGAAYSTFVADRSPSGWEADMEAILAISARISARAAITLPELSRSTGPLDLGLESAAALAGLAMLGIEEPLRDTLAEGIGAAGGVTPALQHGDLWPANLLVGRGEWQLLDFELFGVEKAPLFDTIHLLRTSMAARAHRTAGYCWLDEVRGPSPEAYIARRLLAEAAANGRLDHQQAVGCLLHYLAVFAFRGALLHLPPAFMGPILGEIRRAGELLQPGHERLASLFVPAGCP